VPGSPSSSREIPASARAIPGVCAHLKKPIR
jgi:hypothetical protein